MDKKTWICVGIVIVLLFVATTLTGCAGIKTACGTVVKCSGLPVLALLALTLGRFNLRRRNSLLLIVLLALTLGLSACTPSGDPTASNGAPTVAEAPSM
jgi:hypothetical protein